MNDHRFTRRPRLLPCSARRRRRLGIGLMLLSLAAALNARAATLAIEAGDGDRPVIRHAVPRDATPPATFDASAWTLAPGSQCPAPQASTDHRRDTAATSRADAAQPQAIAPLGKPARSRFGLALAFALLSAALLRGFSIG